MPISLLRLVGLVFALVLVLVAIGRLRRRGAGSRVPATGLLLVGLGLFAVALFPDLVRPIQDVLGLSGEPLGRLVTVLVVSVAIAYVLLFYALGRADRANQRVSRLVRALSAAQLEASRGETWGGVLVCIPALDEAKSLPAVLAEIPTHGRRTARPTSSSSTTAPATGLRTSPGLKGAHVVSHPVNSGQGAALQTGYLVAERLGVEVVVTLDADGQHDPAQMERLVEPIVRDEADFVVGSRRMGRGRERGRVEGARRRDHRLHAADQPHRRHRGQRHRQRLSRHPGLPTGGDRLHRGPVPQPGAVAGRRAGRPAGRRRAGHHPPPDGRQLEEGDRPALRPRVPAGDAQDVAAVSVDRNWSR